MKIKNLMALICIFCVSIGVLSTASAKDASKIVSAGLNVIAAEKPMAVSCVAEREVSFDAEDFERALNLSNIDHITVSRLPERSDGILYLGSTEIAEGQTVSRANISYMKFEFLGENVNKSSFCFSANHSEHELVCELYSLKYANSAPSVDIGEALQVSTYKNVSCYGKLKAYDPEGDRVVFDIIRQPNNGLLKVEESGEYVYVPTKGFTGNDSFKYVAHDEYGNYSASCEVKLKVEAQRSSLVFSDMTTGEYHVAAINLAEKGVISVNEVDGEYYFYPDYEVGRLEYLVMAMKTLGIEMENTSAKTVFYDDDQIPESLKSYVNTALKLGYISGKIDTKGNLVFSPNDKITRAEAAVMLNNMVELEAPILRPVFADKQDLPAWAAEAVYRLAANEIYPSQNGYVSANQPLNRDEGAYMLYKLASISDQ